MIIDVIIELIKKQASLVLKAVGVILGIWLLGMILDKESRDDFITMKFPNIDHPAWIHLFDGSTTEGWRAYNGDSLPKKWTIQDGVLTFSTDSKLEEDFQGGGDIIYYLEEFENFHLYLEWKLPEGGNSGVFYHLKEGFNTPYEVGPEYQLLDDDGWEKINNATLGESQKAGADYAMYSPNENKYLNPAGEWNSSAIIFRYRNGAYRVSHRLNGKKILSFVAWSEDWYKRKNDSKWKDAEKYGAFKKGYIGLQDHDSQLWFRNIKIRKL
ncbi:MAG: DUF1080 domain-containing protein [Flavobacteriaceae bacterium]